MKTSRRQIVSQLLWKTGFSETLQKARSKKTRYVLVFHGVSSARNHRYPLECQPHHDRAEMHAVLTWLAERYTFLSAEAFLTTSQPGVLLTFDDGFANSHTVLLPLLEEFAAPAVFFVTLQHILDPKNWLPATRKSASRVWPDLKTVPSAIANDWYDGMSVAQLRACAEHPLVTIGSRTCSHPHLPNCSETDLENEIHGSKTQLEKLTGTTVDLFAYPTGIYDGQPIKAVQSAGYRAAFAVDRQGYASLRYEIPRIGIYASDPAYLSLKLSGLHRCPIKSTPILETK